MTKAKEKKGKDVTLKCKAMSQETECLKVKFLGKPKAKQVKIGKEKGKKEEKKIEVKKVDAKAAKQVKKQVEAKAAKKKVEAKKAPEKKAKVAKSAKKEKKIKTPPKVKGKSNSLLVKVHPLLQETFLDATKEKTIQGKSKGRVDSCDFEEKIPPPKPAKPAEPAEPAKPVCIPPNFLPPQPNFTVKECARLEAKAGDGSYSKRSSIHALNFPSSMRGETEHLPTRHQAQPRGPLQQPEELHVQLLHGHLHQTSAQPTAVLLHPSRQEAGAGRSGIPLRTPQVLRVPEYAEGHH